MKAKNIYPVYETKAESWERFARIYKLTAKIAGEGHSVPVIRKDIRASWAGIAMYWRIASFLGGKANFMYEAIYHVRYRRFSPDVSTSEELLLTLLIEDELCRCGYAFQVWSDLEEFEEAYQELLFPSKRSRGWMPFCPPCLEMYLAGNMANRIMLKDRRPIDWGDELDCDRATFPYGPDYMRYRITLYERAISVLLPESAQWYEEWTDGAYVAQCIKDKYGMDFTNDQKGFNHLIELATEKNFPRYCARHLYALKNMTPSLLTALWGEKTETMLQRCFLDVYGRHKSTKGSVRSRYSKQNITQSWLYQWVLDRCVASSAMLDKKVKTAAYNIAVR